MIHTYSYDTYMINTDDLLMIPVIHTYNKLMILTCSDKIYSLLYDTLIHVSHTYDALKILTCDIHLMYFYDSYYL